MRICMLACKGVCGYWTSQHKLKIVAASSCGEASKEANFQLMVGALFILNTKRYNNRMRICMLACKGVCGYWTSQHKLKIVAASSCGEASKEANFQLMVGALFILNTKRYNNRMRICMLACKGVIKKI